LLVVVDANGIESAKQMDFFPFARSVSFLPSKEIHSARENRPSALQLIGFLAVFAAVLLPSRFQKKKDPILRSSLFSFGGR